MISLNSTLQVNVDLMGWKDELMNEKFFDLKKEKQDRMINAALKIFAQNGYAHASTDDIVKEAGISKGLLFHYFTNKIGLYSFIYDYSARFVVLELTGSIDTKDNDFFSLHVQIKSTESAIMKGYPYMIAFLNSVKNENVIEAIKEISDKKSVVSDKIEEYFKHANTSLLKSDIDINLLNNMIDYVSEAVLLKNLKINPDKPDLYFKEMKDYLIQLRYMSY